MPNDTVGPATRAGIHWGTDRWLAGTVGVSCAAIAVAELATKLSRKSGPGKQVTVLGQGLRAYHRQGSQGPAVVFENGLGFPQTTWAWVIAGLPREVPILTYDRPGIAWSPKLRGELTLDRQQKLLRFMMYDVSPERPVILVGHSIGGLLAYQFARTFPQLVAGLVLVDSTHPQQFTRSEAQRTSLQPLVSSIEQRAMRSLLGLRAESGVLGQFDALPARHRETSKRAWATTRSALATRRELLRCHPQWLAEVADLTSIGTTPVAVVSSGLMIANDPAHGELQAEFPHVSAIRHHDTVEDASHASLLCESEHAARVVKAINWVRDQHQNALSGAMNMKIGG